MKASYLYIFVIVALFAGFTAVFNFFPRSTVSELEKRELAKFPPFSLASLTDGSFTRKVSEWYSDSEPFRDTLMTLSMIIDDRLRLQTGDEPVSFHASTASALEGTADDEAEHLYEVASAPGKTDAPVMSAADSAFEAAFGRAASGAATVAPVRPSAANATAARPYENQVTANDVAKIANAGIMVVGKDDRVRALMVYYGGANGGKRYAEVANRYHEAFGRGVNIYSMTIPTAIEFYCPDHARKLTRSQRATILHIHSLLAPDVKAVDAYEALAAHASEPIYLRTDHHWAPLGAYYAAEHFARVAGVPFRTLDAYQPDTVRRFVGSMYGYSHDIAVKRAPEDFVFYRPVEVDYTTTYVNYEVDEDFRVVGQSSPYKGPFFYPFRDGASGAYSTFMGSDMKTTCVATSTATGRRLLIIKDSFGNALPGYLFYSFDQVHVVDFRYFTLNMKRYVADHGITDILFANNVFNAYAGTIYANCLRYLDQADHTLQPRREPTDTIPQP